MDNQQQQFQIKWSKNDHSIRKPQMFSKQMQACKLIEKELVQEYLYKTIHDIVGQCHDQYQNGVNNQIFTVQFRKNQQVQFDSFINQIHGKFEQEKGSIFDCNSGQKIKILRLYKNEVRQIVLQMYIYLQENSQFDIVVFIVNAITDLDQRNMYCFEKGLKNKRFVAIICTFNNLQNRLEASLPNFQKYHYKLYNSKDLFCKYMYNCLIDQTIKPYLPSGVLSLISDIDYYSISFHQSCRRFMYCLQKSLLLTHKEHKYVQFQHLITIIENTIINKFKFYPGVKNANQKMLKVILDQKEIYTISEKAIIYEIAFASGVPGNQLIEQLDIITSIRQSLKKYLSKEEQYARFVQYLEEKEEGGQQVIKKKKTRADQLGIDTKKNITPKNKLENQITKIIKDATVLIRQQAASIKWEDIKYQLRIKSQLPYLIKKAWHQDEETSELIQEITKNHTAPITNYLKMFEQEQLGKATYLLKSIQLSGIMSISKKHVKPIIITNFFNKTKFTTKDSYKK